MYRFIYLLFVVFLFISNSNEVGAKIGWQHRNVESNSVIPNEMRVTYSDEDVDIFNNYLQMMVGKKGLPFNELIIETALYFRNVPYVASTLESEEEHLIINLRELDCTTFVENVIALANTVKDEYPSFERFCDYLRLLRYRKGMVSGYTDRLHYFSDWIYENEQAGFVRDMTKQAGGRPYSLNLSFMSSHPESYPVLRSYPEFIEIIKKKEQEISHRNIYAMIPKADINKSQEIKSGDIVCFVTKIDGLDITHVGFVYIQGNVMTFVHASSSAKKVIVDLKSLQPYAESVKSTIGIMIVRPLKNSFFIANVIK
ncbi:MAG: DUF1460 domain-containing protein [Tannerella sp.]|jgi:hypothetical protein|nr:DUF1460 domain-containing protein [Tannerella sp.]